MTTAKGPAESAAPEAQIAANVRQVTEKITAACTDVNRPPEQVGLIAVSKRQSTAAIEAAHEAGLSHFGENYVQEAVAKVQALAHLPLTWHFIGPLQSNKTQQVAQHFSWVHSIDRIKIAKRLNQSGNELNVCVQVNIDADPNKGGVAPEAAASLINAMMPLTHLKVRGLMCILDPKTRPQDGFGAVAALFNQLQQELPHTQLAHWDTLSMGMSGDYPQAINAGATLVRVGTAIFGPRTG